MNETRIRPIRNDDDYAAALERIEGLMDAAPGTSQMDELEVLAQLAEAYEDKHWPINMPSPVAAIEFRMEQAGLTRRDIEPYIGSSGKVSDVLSGKQPLTLKMIRALNKHLGIPTEVLLGDPEARLADDAIAQDCDKYPLSEMASLGWFSEFGQVKGKCEEAMRWLIQCAGTDPSMVRSFARRNDEARHNSKMNLFAFQAWCLQALVCASEFPATSRYKAGSLTEDVLRYIATLSVLSNGPLAAREVLAQLGIKLVIVSHLRHTYLDGAAMLTGSSTPIVALTLRYDRVDNFWHSLVHELVHVKNDLVGDCKLIYDDLNLPSAGSDIELRADREASEALVPMSIILAMAKPIHEFSSADLHTVAQRAHVHPAVVAGRIRHDTGNWRKFARLVVGGGVKQHFVNHAAGC